MSKRYSVTITGPHLLALLATGSVQTIVAKEGLPKDARLEHVTASLDRTSAKFMFISDSAANDKGHDQWVYDEVELGIVSFELPSITCSDVAALDIKADLSPITGAPPPEPIKDLSPEAAKVVAEQNKETVAQIVQADVADDATPKPRIIPVPPQTPKKSSGVQTADKVPTR